MNHENILIELNHLIHGLDSIIDIMHESTKEVIDTGNVNYELKNVINKLDQIIDRIEESDEKNMLETAKDNVTYASLDMIDNVDIFDKIHRLRDSKRILMDIKAKWDVNGPQ
ncbi:MAG: hypothetical protein ACXVHN_07825 [Methanobacterium sp.]